jgi:hypothetical protein
MQRLLLALKIPARRAARKNIRINEAAGAHELFKYSAETECKIKLG